ncbi:VMAP-C domain-containing protein [Streptomyces flavofungini]|uniref:Trypsin-like peptidase domain-containing protein n=1 Tax=Streptomyces flavofungini TaxID=68200 RepID=A0ABS0X5A0_9ACTN|nr:trypsin-like peptidase domain-containing protein [Streptomyces flavofungini]MBJ3808338.1 trypsin-like peptidase domain-containing protein [Streptomyces flavofungini]
MHWRARIGTVGGGAPLGAGVLVDSTRLITCAHVVDGLREVRVTLPGCADGLRATVSWSGDWRRQDDPGDVAVLTLDDPLRVPPCVFAPLGSLRPRKGRTAYELRALGFPRGHEEIGTHVTLRTSEDRQLGSEWLEMDVEQAHLQRLDEGFSGAAVYDIESRQVVGIVTDAVLAGDQEGYLGRMLSLDVIRRHWEALDDLLPLDWLPPAPRHELRALFEDVQVEARTLEVAVRRAFPTLRRDPPHLRSGWQAVRYVAETLTGDDRLTRLLRELGQWSPGGIGPGIAAWMRRWMPGEGEYAGAGVLGGELYGGLQGGWGGGGRAEACAPTGSVMFRAEPMTRGGSLELSVCTVVDGVPVGRAGPVRIRRQQLRARVEALLAEQVGRIHEFDWMLEFVVPPGLMSEPYEEWHIREPGAARPRPMRTVPVVVRHVERLKPLTVSRLTRKRWQTVRARGETRPVPVECGLPYGYEQFYGWLDADDDLCALAYAARPVDDWLSAALDTGVPIMLWRRHDCGGDGHAHCAPKAFLDRLADAVATLEPDRLPLEVMKLRKAAHSPHKGDADHCGHRLTLFWDDPERMPDPPLAMGNPMGSRGSA